MYSHMWLDYTGEEEVLESVTFMLLPREII